jgi:hypothetical protein
MTETKRNRNAQALKNHGKAFRISRKPMVQIAANDTGHVLNDGGDPIPEQGVRLLFAIARDPQTIFASWTIDWPSLFGKILPVDRQVHLRLYGADGLEEKSVAVEPMAAMHCLTTSGRHTAYSIEIGYYQPADVWHSVATSQEVAMPPSAIAETVDLDLATIPLHVGFQQLLNLFGPSNGTALATVMSQFQKRVLSSERPKTLSGEEKTILRKLNASVPEIAAGWRAFGEIDGQKLVRRMRARVDFGSTSPSRRFEGERTSVGS